MGDGIGVVNRGRGEGAGLVGEWGMAEVESGILRRLEGKGGGGSGVVGRVGFFGAKSWILVGACVWRP